MNGSKRPDGLVWCTCGAIMLTGLGEGFVVTLEREQKWMRRRYDSFECPSCSRGYGLSDIHELTHSGHPSGAQAR